MKLLCLCTGFFLLSSLECSSSSTLSMRHRESEGVGYDTGYSTLDYLFSYDKEPLTTLCNLRAHLFNNGHTAGNLGMGLRHSLFEDSSQIGVNIFYDFRNYSIFFAQQLSGGLEWLGKSFDLRCNGYLPFGRNQKFQEKFFESFDGYQAIIEQRLSASLPSIDGEMGKRLSQKLYVATGAYYLFQEESNAIYSGYGIGVKARFDLELTSYCHMGSEITYDPIFHTRLGGYLSLSIPLGKKQVPSSEKILKPLPIYRQEIIPIYTEKRTKVSLNSLLESPVNFLFVNNQARTESKGTFSAPFHSLKEAEKQSQVGDIIYIYPGDKTAKGMDEGIILKENQMIASAGSALHLNDLYIPAQTPHQKPLLTNIHPNEPIIVNPGLSELKGFSFIDSWSYLMHNDLEDTQDILLEERTSPSIWDDPEIKEWIDLSDIKRDEK
ncbi:inverse autotransporter beta domain-containing protein [Rhabdochlamydiaceae symbiont of Dictyostelium giganteum]|uniref:inverse autotransporter beta domain-containing protein n=1 Tax=Rhabdochlamydiaceae symbiont of Dictyostelium giganteum TaxID=3342349 RepID=UPI00384D6F36